MSGRQWRGNYWCCKRNWTAYGRFPIGRFSVCVATTWHCLMDCCIKIATDSDYLIWIKGIARTQSRKTATSGISIFCFQVYILYSNFFNDTFFNCLFCKIYEIPSKLGLLRCDASTFVDMCWCFAGSCRPHLQGNNESLPGRIGTDIWREDRNLTLVSFPVISCSLFTNHPTIRRCVAWVAICL
jgi:hypothetical protein